MHDHPKTRHPLWLLGIVFLTLATSACEGKPAVTGIYCVKEQPDGSILARGQDLFGTTVLVGTSVSRDGGLSWQIDQSYQPSTFHAYCDNTLPSDNAWILSDPSDPAVAYRFTPGVSIERSEDGGATWRREIDLSGVEARTIYHVRRDGYQHGSLYWAVPSDALLHSQTGNLVVAMGYEGTLLRTPQGEWSWIGVWQHQPVDMLNPAISISFIWRELIMGLAFAVVTISTVTFFSKRESFLTVIQGIGLTFVASLPIVVLLMAGARRPLEVVFEGMCIPLPLAFVLPFIVGLVMAKKKRQEEISVLVPGWPYLILSGLLIYFAPREGWRVFGALLLSVPVAIVGLTVAAMVVHQLYQTSRDRLIPTLAFGSMAFLIFAGGYFLWAMGVIAFHRTATLWVWVLSLANLLVGILVLSRPSARAIREMMDAKAETPPAMKKKSLDGHL